MNESDFTTLIDRGSRGLDPDVDRLVAGATRRGRTSLRRRRGGTALAAAAVVALIAGGAAVQAGLGEDRSPQRDPEVAVAPKAEKPKPKPARAVIAVRPKEVPATVASFLPAAEVGPVLREDPYPVIGDRNELLVHFRWNGTLTTVWVSRTGETCAQAAKDSGAKCRTVDGSDVLVWPKQDSPVEVQAVSAWHHGFQVYVGSYNVAAGKNPDGSEDVPPVTDDPAITVAQLTEIVTSDVWFR